MDNITGPTFSIVQRSNRNEFIFGCFYLDVNGDGKRDLIATPNETDGGVNTITFGCTLIKGVIVHLSLNCTPKIFWWMKW